MLPPLSLYIHIPWCLKKCPYCDFNSHSLPSNAPFADYVTALLDDARVQVPLTQNRSITSVFIGGGTPSLLPIAQFERLFDGLASVFSFSSDCEITLEANPASLEHAPFADYLAVGINRLSIGVQSFNDGCLQRLGRIHTAKHAQTAIIDAKRAGFERINCDIMHGLPKQTKAQAIDDLTKAITFGASHISWYQLTIEPNTAFYRNPPDLPDENTLQAIEKEGSALLQAQGFTHYEVSAWVHDSDNPCRHNVNYWQFGDYLAIGAGAHGKVTLKNPVPLLGLDDGGIYRFSKTRQPKDYLHYTTYPKFARIDPVADDELISEYMLNALRLKQGTSVQNFEQTTQLNRSAISAQCQALQNKGLLVQDDEWIAPTTLGFRYVNYLVQSFL